MCGKQYQVCSLYLEFLRRMLTFLIEQTALVGHVKEEFNCLPVENEEFRQISERKALEALKPKRETVFIDKLPGKMLQSRHALPGEQSAFVVSSISLTLSVYGLLIVK